MGRWSVTQLKAVCEDLQKKKKKRTITSSTITRWSTKLANLRKIVI